VENQIPVWTKPAVPVDKYPTLILELDSLNLMNLANLEDYIVLIILDVSSVISLPLE
jgi:hypothetical protein